MKIKLLILIGLFSLQGILAQELIVDSVKVKQDKLMLDQKNEKERIKTEQDLSRANKKAEKERIKIEKEKIY